MRGPYLFPVLRGQRVTALRVCDPGAGSTHFGAIALQCERHALLCYCAVRYLRHPHGSVFGLFGGKQAILPFRVSLCEAGDQADWLPITAGAHWSHHVDPALPVRGDVFAEAPQLVRNEDAAPWQLALRFPFRKEFRLSWIAEGQSLRLSRVITD
jgi:hypothetical protein